MKGKRVKELREKLELSQEQVAQLVGITRERISQIENSSEIGVIDDTLYGLAKALHVDPAELRGEQPLPIEACIDIPVVGYVPCGMPLFVSEQREGYVSLPANLVSGKLENLFLVRASGNSLIGDNIFDGVYMLVQRYADFVDGGIYVIRLQDEVVARHVYRDGTKARLVSSAGYQEIKTGDIEIIGRVVLSGKWERH